jgi:hypothetical protein
MATKIEFEYEGEQFTLEFTARTVREMERQGFALANLDNSPMTTLPDLFRGAFKAHHKNVSKKKVDAIYEALDEKEELLHALATMYYEPIAHLMGQDDENVEEKDEKKVSWITTK